MTIAVKVPIQKTSVYQTVTRQNAVILPPILFAVHNEFTFPAASFLLSLLLLALCGNFAIYGHFQIMIY